MTPQTPCQVFISYSHDSESHREVVLQLAQKLRSQGVNVVLDRYVNGAPSQGWPRWMLDELESSTHVLCVCTPTYYRRFRGHEQQGKGKGVTWEGAVITQELYDANCHNRRIIPVLFGDAGHESIPEPLRSASYYRIESDFEKLYDAILGQGGVEPAPLGVPRFKPRSGSATSASPEAESEAKNPSPASSPEPTPEELSLVFTHTVAAIESALSTAPSVARFLGPDASGDARLIRSIDGKWKVETRFANGGQDTTPVLRGINDRLQRFAGPRHEWDALEMVVGGVLVMSMNPQWVWARRLAMEREVIPFPKLAERVDIGSREWAQFLNAIASALADGCAQLERVFGPLDARSLPDLSKASPAITLLDRRKEIQRHFVRYVLGPSDEWDANALDGEQLDVLFKRVTAMFRVALAIDRNPYIASGHRLAQLANEIKKHLDASHLLLFAPTESGSEADLMRDPVVCLILLKRIYQHIQKNRPSI